MEILKNFGVDYYLLGAQVVNFLIVLYVLKRLLYKPVLGMLKKREKTIKEGLEKAEEARLLMEKTLEKEKAVLKKAQNEAQKLLEDAKNQALEMSKESEIYAKTQADKIIKQAKEQIDQEVKSTQEKLTAYVGTLAVEFLQKTTKDFFSSKEQDEVVTKAIKKLKEKSN
ncbi:ATP synthase F0 subunit B [Candidatus Microgenomates bacterium]|nr:MAG: ATP synthase F0 subunit B [Candidatus Microgenomates bacterium]